MYYICTIYVYKITYDNLTTVYLQEAEIKEEGKSLKQIRVYWLLFDLRSLTHCAIRHYIICSNIQQALWCIVFSVYYLCSALNRGTC